MQSIWLSLLWKEWREHRWKLAALSAILLGVPLLMTVVLEPWEFFTAFTVGITPYVILAGMFLGMSLAAGENASGTAPFLQALPSAMWRPALTKLCVALLTAAVPIFLGAVLVYAVEAFSPASWQSYREEFSAGTKVRADFGIVQWLQVRVTCGTLAVVSLLIWVAATGVNRRDEIRAGATSAIVFAALLGIGLWFFNMPQSHDVWQQPVWVQTLIAACPTGTSLLLIFDEIQASGTQDGHSELNYGAVSIAAIVSHSALVAWYLWRFGHASSAMGSEAEPVVNGEVAEQSKPPRRSQFGSIAWKQFRETGPLVAIGLAGLISIPALVMLHEGLYGDEMAGWLYAKVTLSSFARLGWFIAMLIGIGIFSNDLSPELHTFWRSRPIHFNLWFWTKFLTGLAITVVALGVPMLVARWYQLRVWDPGGQLGNQALMGFAVHVLTYCMAVATMSLVRRPVYAAILAFSFLMGGLLSYEYFVRRAFSTVEFNPLLALGLSLVLSVAITPVAWLSVRYDWSWKS